MSFEVLEKEKAFDAEAIANFRTLSKRRATVPYTTGLEDYKLQTPKPPTPGIINHRSIELNWLHVKESLPRAYRFKFIIQDKLNSNDQWNTGYSGFGVTKIYSNLVPQTDYAFRICVVNDFNERSEYSEIVIIKTTEEPLTGEELHKSIATENLHEIERILTSENGDKILEIPDKFGNPPIMIAVNRNNVDILELLLENGANVNIQTESGKTPLMLAAFAGKINVIKVLRSHRASYDIRDYIGLSTLHYAVDGGNLTAIRYILNDGHEVDPVDKSGWTPLIRACSIDGSIQVVSILLSYKANVNAVDNEKKNSLTIAVINNNLYLTKMLVEHGADFMAKTESGSGCSAYDLARQMEKRHIVSYFQEILDNRQKKKF